MYAGKPVIGMAGGIGSGKSFVAGLFGKCGCVVIDSDALARDVLQEPDVKAELQRWWGDAILTPVGAVDRAGVSRRAFADPQLKEALELLIHPRVETARRRAMAEAKTEPPVVAFVWDSPLLFETRLNDRCDAVVFVEAPLQERVRRVVERRGWDAAELNRRENLQWPLDKKRNLSDYSISNTARGVESPDAGSTFRQVQEILKRILQSKSRVGTFGPASDRPQRG